MPTLKELVFGSASPGAEDQTGMIGADSLVDMETGRGTSADPTEVLTGGRNTRSDNVLLGIYRRSGFMQRIVHGPAKDAVREWFEIVPKADTPESKKKAADELQEAMAAFNVKKKLGEMLKWSRIYPRGSGLFFGVMLDNIEDQKLLSSPLPDTIRRLEYINVIDRPNTVSFEVRNTSQPTKRDYNKVDISLSGELVDPSRLVWWANDFITEDLEGLSTVNTAYGGVVAQDNALWSASHLMRVVSLVVLKSDAFVNMPKEKKLGFLARFKRLINTQSVVGIKEKEELERLNIQLTGLKEILDFIFENLSAISGIPKNVLLGRAHGVITAGEFDMLNYYAAISEFQQNVLEPIIRKIIDLFLRVENLAPYKTTKGDFSYDIEFKPLWKMSPDAQADIDKKRSETDKANIESGKISPEEARLEDPLTMHLGPFEADPDGEPSPEETGEEGGTE